MKFSFDPDRETHAFCHYHIDAERRLRTEVYEGEVGLAEMRSMAQCMTSDPRWAAGHHCLIDLRAASLNLTTNEILRLGLMQRQDAHVSKGWRVYVVATSADFGVVRMLARWGRTAERSQYFRTRGEAERWLATQGMSVSPPAESERELKFPLQPAIAPLRKIG